MKQLFLSMVLLLALAACSNEKEISPTIEKEHAVVFNVSTLDVEVQPMSRATSPASDVLTNIEYCIRDINTDKFYEGKQSLEVDGSDFGTIKLWLPAGTYEVTFFGYGTKNKSGQAYMYRDMDYNSLWLNVKNKDSFIYNEEITIEQSTANIDVNLTRVNGALVIKLADEIPSDIGRIEVSFNYYPRWGVESEKAYFEGNGGLSTAYNEDLTIIDSRVEEYVYYILPQVRTVTLSIYGSNGTQLGATSVSAEFFRNKRTIIQGNLLDIISQKPFSITVSDEWEDDVVIPLQ